MNYQLYDSPRFAPMSGYRAVTELPRIAPEIVEYYQIIGTALSQLDKVEGGINLIVTIVLKQFRNFLEVEKLQPPELKYISLLQEQALFPGSPLLIRNIDGFLGYLEQTNNIALVLNYLGMLLELKCMGHIPFALNESMRRGIHKRFDLVTKWDDSYRIQPLVNRVGIVEVNGGSLVDTSAFNSSHDITQMLVTDMGHRGIIHNGNIYRLWAVELLAWMKSNEHAINATFMIHNWKGFYEECFYGINTCLRDLQYPK